jgi:predicted ArsR family transcriptional regulator
MVRATWESRELPILRAIHDLEEADSVQVTTGELAQMAGISEPDARRAFHALLEDGYVQSGTILGGSPQQVILFPSLRGDGRRAIEQWPSETALAALLSVLDERIASGSGQEQTRFRGLRDSILSIGEQAAGSLLADALRVVAAGG